MKLIIPMAGRGSRLRPHTLTIPKPLVPIAGKPMVQRLAESLTKSMNSTFDEIAFIIGDFGETAEAQLIQIAENLGAKGKIYHQEQPLGPGHAIQCASESLNGPCVVAFADTLFYADFKIDSDLDGLIWVKKVKDPSMFGVVTEDENGHINQFVEKPTTFVSDLAIVGIYYFKEGEKLRDELNHMISEDIREKGEYQLTTALRLLNERGHVFGTRQIAEWLDCGNKDAVIHANRRILDVEYKSKNYEFEGCCIIPPCVIGKNVKLTKSIIGPYVSIGDNTEIDCSIIENTIIQNKAFISKANINDSMIGNYTKYIGSTNNINIGDYSKLES